MGQKKLARFAAIKNFSNVLEYPENMAGNWHQHFGNTNAISLELACGKGEYAVGLGALYPEENFIGIDIKGNRIFIGAKKALDNQLNNVAFLRTQIQFLDRYFAQGEVKDIWITFADPHLRRSKHAKRLTHPQFLRIYQKIGNGATVHLKTDSPVLYNYTKMIVDLFDIELQEDIEQVYDGTVRKPELFIKTHYEGLDIAQSSKIHYLRFILPSAQLIDKDTLVHQWVFNNEQPTGDEQEIN
jgi:tRNA (guanine-N7-)-methyltransferase